MITPLLTIMLPTTVDRRKTFYLLLEQIFKQINDYGIQDMVEVLIDEDTKQKSIGKKRQDLLERATGAWWYIKKKVVKSGLEFDIDFVERSNGQNQFAMHRADRDGWHFNPDGLIDAHLPRPLTNEDNFNKVYELFKIKYPNDNLQWMIDYRNEYLKLL